MVTKYPIVTVTGPKQSGKSTLLKSSFPDYKYVSLEDPDMRLFATDDPRGFLATFPDKTGIDEAQRVPSLFSYILFLLYRPFRKPRFMKKTAVERFFIKRGLVAYEQLSFPGTMAQIFCVCQKNG